MDRILGSTRTTVKVWVLENAPCPITFPSRLGVPHCPDHAIDVLCRSHVSRPLKRLLYHVLERLSRDEGLDCALRGGNGLRAGHLVQDFARAPRPCVALRCVQRA